MNKIYDDSAARWKIRTNINENYFVEAGAGSGKTSVLVDRMVRMVEEGLDISRICAITFTKAAAAEFYARFQKKLSESASPNAKKALKDIDLCFMGTIDSFCNMVLSEHPAKAGVPSDAAVIADDELMRLYKREYQRIQSGAYSSELKDKCLKFKNLFYNHEEIFLKTIRKLADNKNAEFVVTPFDGESIDKKFAHQKREITSIFRALLDNPQARPVSATVEVNKAWDALLNDSKALFESWDDNLSGVFRTLSKLEKIRLAPEFDILRLGPGYDKYFVEKISQKNGLEYYKIDPQGDVLLVKTLKALAVRVATDFAISAEKVISDTLRSVGKLTFSDYLIYLRDMLREDAATGGKLISHIYNRHSYFLIDEFQDTNPIQAEIFFYLTAKEPKVGWKECRPRKGSLFIVGDPKQSIYRFRSADVSSFLRVRDLFKNPEIGEVLYLTRNFRSSDVLCAYFNDVFTGLLPCDTDIQSKFSKIPLGEKKPYTASLGGVYKYEAVAKADREPADVARIISGITGSEDITIQDRDEGGQACPPRRINYSDIMLITPNKNRLASFMKEFNKAGIPFRVEGKVIFSDCPALSALSKLFSAVANPYDKAASFAALNLTKGFGGNITTEDLAEYHRLALQMSSAAVFNMLLEKERVFERVGTANAEYVYFAMELLRSEETNGGVTSLIEGAEFIRALLLDESKLERCVQLKQDANCVHIANLHKVKGLEAPVVILADPSTITQNPDLRIDYTTDPPKGWIFGLGDSGKTSTDEFEEEEILEKAVLAAEKTRLLYVAVTRAASALIAADYANKGGKRLDSGMWKPLIDEGTPDIFENFEFGAACEKEKETFDAAALREKAEAESLLNNRQPQEKSYEILRPSKVTIASRFSEEEEEYDEELSSKSSKSAAAKKENPALVGTMIHKMMEALVSSRGKADLKALCREIASSYDQAKDPAAYSNLLYKAGETILSGGYEQSGDVPKDILAELLAADEIYCEVPFCLADADEKQEKHSIANGVIDAVYRKNGLWHIIDYKTNADARDLADEYAGQLNAYVKAFKALTGCDADAKIYHIAV